MSVCEKAGRNKKADSKIEIYWKKRWFRDRMTVINSRRKLKILYDVSLRAGGI